MPKLSLEFLGSGTSVGVPAIGCDCAVCASADPRNKRLRSSALVRGFTAAGRPATTVVIDTSADFRQQMLRSRVRALDAVLMTHHHADHVVGIDDVRRFNALQNTPLDCWATPETLASLRRSFEYVFVDDDSLRWGLPCLRPRPFAYGQPFEVGCLRIEPLEQDHTVIVSSGFRITCAGSPALAYCLDLKRFPPATIERLKGVHTLVLDMLREKPHPTHLSLGEALEIVAEIKPKRTYFAHIAHEVDHAVLQARLPRGVWLAYDGLVVDLD